MDDSRFVVGIDLGTSNSALAYVDTMTVEELEDGADVLLLEMDQVTAPGAVESRPTLPSVVYVRGESELPEGALNLPWRADPGYCVGAFAREQGAKIPSRMIYSSKSWLCHAGVDRESRFLPYQSKEDDAKRSPVEVATLILDHMRAVWDSKLGMGQPGMDLADQKIILCVPASFDAAARNLTVKAAQQAGLKDLTLLEEPQAAFHSWIEQTGRDWRNHVAVGDIVLVVDVGGGTSDFSLIAVTEREGELELRRLAVGEHILLGGDNMDLALAYTLAERIEKDRGRKLDAFQMNVLVQQCRVAKEHLLSNPEAESVPIVILGRGSSVIGGTIRTELRREGFQEMLVDGFFPRCKRDDRPERPRRSGFREAGLPYAADPAITLHLAQFLGRQHEMLEELFPERAAKGSVLPTAILFNGGVFRAEPLRRRVVEVVSSWCAEAGEPAPRVMSGTDLDLAVARGAAYLGLAKRGRGVRIRGGSPRSYYVGVESAAPAVPGMRAPLKALCVVPYGMEEGASQTISGADIDLCIWTGEPAVFRFLSSTTRRHDKPGALLDVDDEQFVEHNPIETVLGPGNEVKGGDGKKGSEGRPVEVDLRSHLTEIGTLEIACVERGKQNTWNLEFNVRAQNEQ